jgi:hypothetical protein
MLDFETALVAAVENMRDHSQGVCDQSGAYSMICAPYDKGRVDSYKAVLKLIKHLKA